MPPPHPLSRAWMRLTSSAGRLGLLFVATYLALMCLFWSSSVELEARGTQEMEVKEKLAQTTQARPIVNDLLRRMNYRGAVDASRGGSRVHDLFNPDKEAILFEKRTHPTHNLVIDVGSFDGMDVAYPAFQNGYTVVAFELVRKNQQNIVRNWEKRGLVKDKDFRVIDVAEFVDNSASKKNMFLPLQEVRLFLICAGASDETKRVSIKGAGTTSQVDSTKPGENFLVEIDRLIPSSVSVFLLKTDAEGHDGRALKGATNLIHQHRVYAVTLEFRPKSLREHNTDPVGLLKWLWNHGIRCYDMNTHPGYEPEGILPERRGLGRGSLIEDFVAWLDAVPISDGPKGDKLGGWEDLICAYMEE